MTPTDIHYIMEVGMTVRFKVGLTFLLHLEDMHEQRISLAGGEDVGIYILIGGPSTSYRVSSSSSGLYEDTFLTGRPAWV